MEVSLAKKLFLYSTFINKIYFIVFNKNYIKK